MATLPPPPSKRQKTAASALTSRHQEIEAPPEGSVRIRFIQQATGEAGDLPPISVPLAQASVRNLTNLLNDLQGREGADNKIPYQFFFVADATHAGEALGDNADIYNALVKTGKANTEGEITLQYAPQAVFRVNPATRLSCAIPGHGQAILAVQFSPVSSSRLASGSGDNTARIFDCDTGTPFATLKGHTSWVLVVSYSPDGKTLATGSMDNAVRLWDSETGNALGGSLKGHTKWVTSLSWEPYHIQAAGRPRVASSSKDCTVRIWDVITKRTDLVLTGHKSNVSCVLWGGTGILYTASHDKTIKMWKSSGELVHTLSAHAHWVNHLALSTQHVLRTAYHDHTGKAPPTDDEKLAKAKERFQRVATVNNRTVERLVSASDDFTMYLWEPTGDTPTKPIARLIGHQKLVNHVSFSPNGVFIASAGWDNHVKLWSARDGKFIVTLRGHVAPVYQLCWSADSRLLVSGSKDTTLKVWDPRTGKMVSDLPGSLDEVYAVDWSPDGQRIGSGGKDKQVRIWRN